MCAGWRGHPDLSGTALFYAAHIAVNGMTDAPVVGEPQRGGRLAPLRINADTPICYERTCTAVVAEHVMMHLTIARSVLQWCNGLRRARTRIHQP